MKLLLCIFLFASAVSAQEIPKSPDDVQKEIPKCQHDDEDSFYDNLHHSAPVRILAIDGRTVTTVRITKTLIRHDTYTMDLSNIRMPKDVYRIDKNKLYFLLYCAPHRQVFVIEEVLKK